LEGERGDEFVNKAKLKEPEENFIMRFPGGFSNPQMFKLTKKHKANQRNVSINEGAFLLFLKDA